MRGTHARTLLFLFLGTTLGSGTMGFSPVRLPCHQITANQQHNVQASVATTYLFSCETILFTSQGQKKRKRKQKYEKFSKISSNQRDPWDALIQESEREMEAIRKEKEAARYRDIHPPPQDLPRLEFPNNKDIDPYDPTTFGYTLVGTVLGAHGVHGWNKVQGCTDFPERLTQSGMLLHLKHFHKRAPRGVTLAKGKLIGPDLYLVKLSGIFDRGAAQKLKGATLYYAKQQDTILKEDDIIVSDMVGYQVKLMETSQLVGEVEGVVLAEEMCSIPGLGHHSLEVKLAGHSGPTQGSTAPKRPSEDLVLIPVVPDIVQDIDPTSKVVSINPPAGLLDLTYARSEKVRIKGLLPAPSEE